MFVRYVVRFLKKNSMQDIAKKGHLQPEEVSGIIYGKKDQYPYKVKVKFGNITAIYKYESGLPTMGCSTMGR